MYYRHFQTTFFLGLLLGTSALVYLLFRPFLAPLVFAGTMAIIFWPVHRRLRRYLGHGTVAAVVSVLAVLAGVLTPLLIISATAVVEARQFLAWLSQERLLDQYLRQLAQLPQTLLGQLAPSDTVGPVQLDQYLRQIAEFFLRNAGALLSGIAGTLVHLLVFTLALYYCFKEGGNLAQLYVKLSPLPNDYDRKIINRVRTMVTYVIQGSVLVAVIQGVLAGIGFAVFRVPGAVLWGMVTVLAAFVPWVGTAITVVPAILYLLVVDRGLAALGLTLWGVVVVGLTDNLLHPEFIGARAKVNPLLVLIAVLGGLQVFGIIGFLVGPIILSVFLALLEIYQQEFKRALLQPPEHLES